MDSPLPPPVTIAVLPDGSNAAILRSEIKKRYNLLLNYTTRIRSTSKQHESTTTSLQVSPSSWSLMHPGIGQPTSFPTSPIKRCALEFPSSCTHCKIRLRMLGNHDGSLNKTISNRGRSFATSISVAASPARRAGSLRPLRS